MRFEVSFSVLSLSVLLASCAPNSPEMPQPEMKKEPVSAPAGKSAEKMKPAAAPAPAEKSGKKAKPAAAPAKKSSEAAQPAPAKKPAETVKTTAAPAGEKSGEDSISDAEMLYIKALREPDKVKRHEMFKVARKALKVEADKKNYKAHLLLGYMADLGQGMRKDDLQAVRHYRIAADSGMPEAKIALAEFWRRNDMFPDEAIAQITSIPDYEHNPQALCSLGAIYYSKYENDKGFPFLKKAYESPKSTPGIQLEVKKIIHGAFERYFKGNRLDAALKELKRSEELKPVNHVIPYLMGLVQIRRGDLKDAEKMFDLSLSRNPAVPEPYRERALVRVRTGRVDDAIDDAKIAYAISGGNPACEQALLQIYLAAKRFDALFRFLDGQLKKQPKRHELRLFRVSLLVQKKDYAAAYRDLQVLMKDRKNAADPDVLEAYANVASTLGKYDEGIRANEAALKKGFRPVPALNLAELYIITNQFAKAVELLHHPEFARQKDPLFACVVSYLEASALLAQGKTADEQMKKFRSALPAFLSARKDPGEWDVTMFRKWLKKAALPDAVKKQIAEMTDAFETSPKPADKSAPVKGAKEKTGPSAPPVPDGKK